MTTLLFLLFMLPLIGFISIVAMPSHRERSIAWTSHITAALQVLLLSLFVFEMLIRGEGPWDQKLIVLISAGDIEIALGVLVDKIGLVFGYSGALLLLLISIFSQSYMHRESGYKRFYGSLSLFFLGFNLIVFGSNYETLFVGWEFIGITSFLLIGFYRERYLPIKNAFKVLSVYRLADICLILALWMSHHAWHENIQFIKFLDTSIVSAHWSEHATQATFVVLMIILAASIKSAQFPFFTWLPRAMEGPSTSSAIFYGALSAHIGIFLLLRTAPFWEAVTSVKIIIGIIGGFTVITGALTTRAQSSVKTQIAYASLTQIGFMFIEVAAGFYTLAMVHFVSNAFLRAYQLLVSPAVLSYLVHDQFYHFDPAAKNAQNSGSSYWKNSWFMLGLREWNLDALQFRFLWRPFKWIGNKMELLATFKGLIVFSMITLIGLLLSINRNNVSQELIQISALLFSIGGLFFVLASFSYSGNAIVAWASVILGQLMILLAADLHNPDFSWNYIVLSLSGIAVSAITGLICLRRVFASDKDIALNKFHGYVREFPFAALIFLLACLAFAGFPVSPAFLGVDLLFSHIQKGQWPLVIIVGLSYLFMELAVIRIYLRIFLGPYKKLDHAIAYRSS